MNEDIYAQRVDETSTDYAERLNSLDESQAIDQTSPELIEALAASVANVLGQTVMAEAYHTGGGVMVAAVDLSQDGRWMGRQLWLTREGPNEWLLGLYDFAADEEDEGICVAIRGYRKDAEALKADENDPTAYTSNSPWWVASQVAGILERLGVTTLQGG